MAAVPSATSAQHDDLLSRAISEAVNKRVAEVIEAEVDGIAERVSKRLREEVGQIAGSIFSNYDMSQNGRVITIRVQVGPDNTKDFS